MEKLLIRQKDINSLTGLVGLRGVVLVKERDDKKEIFIDLVLPGQNQFWRVCRREGGKERVFRSINTAVNLLLFEGFPEVTIKVDREFQSAENLHDEG